MASGLRRQRLRGAEGAGVTERWPSCNALQGLET